MPDGYVFPGLPKYVDAAADAQGLDEPEYRTRARTGYHADAIATALSQVVSQASDEATGRIPRGTVESVLGRIGKIRKSLAAQLAAIDAAVAEVEAHLPKAAPADPEPNARKSRERKARPLEPIPPGVGEPTGPPAKTQDVDREADDDEKVGKRHDSK